MWIPFKVQIKIWIYDQKDKNEETQKIRDKYALKINTTDLYLEDTIQNQR